MRSCPTTSAPEAGAIDRIEFDQRLERRADEILALLSQSRWNPLPGVPRSAELRKNLGRLYTAIADARRLVRTELLDEGSRSALVELLDVEPGRLSSDSLGELLAAVDELLIAKGDDLYVCGVLESEYARDAVDRAPASRRGAPFTGTSGSPPRASSQRATR